MRADFGSPPRLRPQTRQDAADDLIDATPSIRPLRYDLWKLFKLFLVVVSSPLAECSQWGEDPRWQQCRLTVAGAPYLFGPPTASGNPVTGNPQQCAYLFPGRNNYNKENEEVIGSFVAPDCGACAAACAASYLSANYESTPGPYRLMNEVVDQMSFQALRDFGDMLITSVDQCMPCTDWNYCSPEVAVVTQSTSLFEWEDSWNGFATFVPDDPYFQGRSDNCDSCNNCVGRFVENFRGNGGGEIRPYGYVGFGPDLCLVKSTTGCNNPGRTNQVPAGTCTLKYNPATEVAAHFPPEQADDDPHSTPAYIGNTNEDLWDYVDGEWSKRNTMWDGSLDGCPNEEVPYPTVNASDLAPCPGIDPEAGVFMSGMCDWTPSMTQKPMDLNRCAYGQDNLDYFKKEVDEWVLSVGLDPCYIYEGCDKGIQFRSEDDPDAVYGRGYYCGGDNPSEDGWENAKACEIARNCGIHDVQYSGFKEALVCDTKPIP